MALEESEEKKTEEGKASSSESGSISREEHDALLKKLDDLANQQKQITQPQVASGINMEDIGKMFAGLMKDQGKRETFSENGQFNFTNFGDESVGDDDFLEEKDWKVFVAFRVLHYIADDKRNGKPIKAPLGMIKFKYVFSNRDQQGKEENIVHVSQYICKSKAILEFLMNHSQYGISFFDRVDLTLAKSNSSLSLLNKMNFLKKKGQQDLRELTNQFPEVVFTANLDDVRIQLAQAMVKAEEELAVKQTKASLNSTYLARKELA